MPFCTNLIFANIRRVLNDCNKDVHTERQTDRETDKAMTIFEIADMPIFDTTSKYDSTQKKTAVQFWSHISLTETFHTKIRHEQKY